jgi:hypothetical protein
MISKTSSFVAALVLVNACSTADTTTDGGSDAMSDVGTDVGTGYDAQADVHDGGGSGYDAPSYDAECADALANGATFGCGAQTCSGAVAQVCAWPRYTDGGMLAPIDAASCIATPPECTCTNTHVCECILAYIGDLCDGAAPKCPGGGGYNQAIVSCPFP